MVSTIFVKSSRKAQRAVLRHVMHCQPWPGVKGESSGCTAAGRPIPAARRRMSRQRWPSWASRWPSSARWGMTTSPRRCWTC
jgi:hypothetical protein